MCGYVFIFCVHLWSCPVAHLLPVELFTKQLLSAMLPPSAACLGERIQQDGMRKEHWRKGAKDGRLRQREGRVKGTEGEAEDVVKGADDERSKIRRGS